MAAPFYTGSTVTLTSKVGSPPPLITPRNGVTSAKSRPQPSVMCSNDGMNIIGRVEVDPADGWDE